MDDGDNQYQRLRKLQFAVRGFNPLLRDSEGKSGIKGEIFEHKIWDKNMGQYLKPDYITHSDGMTCEVLSKTNVRRSFNSFFEELTESYKFYDSKKESKKGGILWFTWNKGSHVQTSKDGKLHQMKKMFQDRQNEMYVTQAKCLTDEFEIMEFGRKSFTEPFMRGLQAMSASYQKRDRIEQRYVLFKTFIEDFGFFYIKSVKLGAKLSYESIYSSGSSSSREANKNGKCEAQASYQTSGAGFETPEINLSGGVEKGGIQVSASTSLKGFGYASESEHLRHASACGSKTTDKSSIESYGLVTNRLYTVGSKPTSFEKWVDQEFEPEPIEFVLKEMSSIFDPANHLANERVSLINEKLKELKVTPLIDIRELHQGYKEMINLYCERENLDCSILHEKGCGLTVKCPIGQRCENDYSAPEGYRCIAGILIIYYDTNERIYVKP